MTNAQVALALALAKHRVENNIWESNRLVEAMNPLRRQRLLAASLAIVLASSGAALAQQSAPDQRPNFLVFMADDQYKASVGCYGAQQSHTPNIDRLATQGLRFTRCFTPSSICTPNRGAFLSGMVPLKNGAHANHSGFFDGVQSLPNYMRKLGYRACLVNKDGIRRPSDLYRWEFRIEESDEPIPGTAGRTGKRTRKTRFDELEAFLSSRDRRPFCVLHASRQPHAPYLQKLENGLAGYDASNFYMDSEFGHDIALLDKYGLTESTVVVYVNDNEAGIPRSKYTLYETGINVSCIVRWPNHVRAGRTTDAIVSLLDFLPTFVELAGGKADPKWDGKSMAALWRGETDKHHDALYFSYTGVTVGSKRNEVPFPIRGYRTSRFKYLRNLNHKVGHPMQNGAKLPPEELYDLVRDPGERTNLASDPEYDEVKRTLSGNVEVWMRKTDDRGIDSELESLRKYPPRR